MKRIYVAGPMSGKPDLNFTLFNSEAARLRALGYEVINPAEINGGESELAQCKVMTAQQLKEHWRRCMVADITQMVTCDGVALLPGWQHSKGASLEAHIAQELGLMVRYASALVAPVETVVA